MTTLPVPKQPVRRQFDEKEISPERRPRRKGEASEARRIEAGFRMLAGEGVYVDDTDET